MHFPLWDLARIGCLGTWSYSALKRQRLGSNNLYQNIRLRLRLRLSPVIVFERVTRP